MENYKLKKYIYIYICICIYIYTKLRVYIKMEKNNYKIGYTEIKKVEISPMWKTCFNEKYRY